MIEALACGTPVAALERGAVREVIENDLTGGMFSSLDKLVEGLPRVLALDRSRVRARAVERFGIDRMVDEYVDAYKHLVADAARSGKTVPDGAVGERLRTPRK
jgi:glycosyltransferase involved in cell wall biosynthesis